MNLLKLEQDFDNIRKVSYDLDLINRESKRSINKLVSVSEKMYYDQMHQACKLIAESKPKVILLSGPSASGKTTTAEILRSELGNKYNIGSVVVSLDDFFLNPEDSPVLPDGSPDLENLLKLDLLEINKFVENIMTKGEATKPTFDFASGRRSSKTDLVTVKDNDVVIIEGIHALNPALIQNQNFLSRVFKVYVCTNSNFFLFDELVISDKTLRMMRRLLRDYLKRGEKIDSFLQKWPNVLVGEEKYIIPFKTQADVVIDSVHMYEPLVYAKYLKTMLESYMAESINPNLWLKKMLYALRQAEEVDKSVIPQDSMLWEVLLR